MTNSFHWLRDTYPHLGILAGQTLVPDACQVQG